MYYKINDTTRECWYTNEPKSGYTKWAFTYPVFGDNAPSHNRTVHIELYNDKFILPEYSVCLFYNSRNTNWDTSKWDTSEVISMWYMFDSCSTVQELDLSSFDTSKVTNMSNMFNGCMVLRVIKVSNDFITSNVTESNYMFNGCVKLVGEKDTVYDSSHIDKTYAHVDDAPDNPGYFTYKAGSSKWREYEMYIKEDNIWNKVEVYA